MMIEDKYYRKKILISLRLHVWKSLQSRLFFFWGRNLEKCEAGNGQRIISSYVISLSNFLIMEKYMRKLREWLNLQQQKKREKRETFALASFVRCNPQMKVFRKCYAITLIPTLFPIYILARLYVLMSRFMWNFSETMCTYGIK